MESSVIISFESSPPLTTASIAWHRCIVRRNVPKRTGTIDVRRGSIDLCASAVVGTMPLAVMHRYLLHAGQRILLRSFWAYSFCRLEWNSFTPPARVRQSHSIKTPPALLRNFRNPVGSRVRGFAQQTSANFPFAHGSPTPLAARRDDRDKKRRNLECRAH